MVGAGSDTGDSAISEDKDGSDGANVVLDLGCNTVLVELVLPKVTSVSQPGRVEDADLRKRLRVLTTLRNVGTYHYAVVAREFVKAGRVGLRAITQIILLVGAVEDVEVVVINSLSGKDINDEFQE